MIKDRYLIIDELSKLLIDVRQYFLKNINGLDDEKEARNFINSFLMQCLILWFFQLKGFFNHNTSYLITKFKNLSQIPASSKHENYFNFFRSFLSKITITANSLYYNDINFGELVILGPSVLVVDKEKLKSLQIPNNCFYIENRVLDMHISSSKRKMIDLPIFNILEGRNWGEEHIDEYLFGAIYEKLLTHSTKKKIGAYYTPESITAYTAKLTLEKYLIDHINENFDSNYLSLDEILNSDREDILICLLITSQKITVLDPAVGTGHFLEGVIKILLQIYRLLWNYFKKEKIQNLRQSMSGIGTNDAFIGLFEITNEQEFIFNIKYYIINNNLYGSDIDSRVIKIAQARLLLYLMKSFNPSFLKRIDISALKFNLKCGNSLLGFKEWPQEQLTRQLNLDPYFFKEKENGKAVSYKIPIKYQNQLSRIEGELKIPKELLNDIKFLLFALTENELNYSNLKKAKAVISQLNTLQIQATDSRLIESAKLLSSQLTQALRKIFDSLYSIQYKQNLEILNSMKLFHWPLEFPELYYNNESFDIIITNPPYLGESGNKDLFRIYSSCMKEYYEGKIDLWYLFLHRALDLISSNAYLTLITSNYWITASGGEKMRQRIFHETSIINFINFGENKVFSNAQGVHTNILTLKKGKVPNNRIQVALFNKIYPLNTDLTEKIVEQLKFGIYQKELVFRHWDSYFHFLPEDLRIIINYMIDHSKILKECGFQAKEGIVTGLNKITSKQIKKYNLNKEVKGTGVFILDKNVPRDLEIINSFKTNELELLKPFYKNSDISRFTTSYQTQKRIVYLTRKSVGLERLPNIKNHLKKFERILIDSLDNPPFINRPREKTIFTGYKILTPQRSTRNTFAYNSVDWHAAQDVYYIISETQPKIRLKSLLLLLNSKLAFFWFHWMGKRKGNQLELFGEPLNHFPIPKDFDNYQSLSDLADFILFLSLFKELDGNLMQIKDYFETITETIIYEIYFKGNLYSNEKESLNDFSLYHYVMKSLNAINFENHELLTQQSLNHDSLSEDFLLNLRENQEEILQTILDTYEIIQKNKKISKIMNEINSNKWIIKIENFYNNNMNNLC